MATAASRLVSTTNPLALREQIAETQAGHARDYGAALAMLLVIVFYHVTDAALRTDSPIGLAFRNVYLRRILWILLASVAGALIVGAVRAFWGRQGYGGHEGLMLAAQAASGIFIGVFAINAGIFVFTSNTVVTESPMTAILATLAFGSTIALSAPWERARQWRKSIRQMTPALVIAFGVLVFWEVAIEVFQVKQFLLPKPTIIGQNLSGSFPDLISKTWVTFQNALWGYGVGCGIGILVGLASARFVAFSRAILPFAIAANSTPIIAFAPIMGFWFGVTRPESKIAVVAIMVFFPCMINTVKGLLSVDQNTLELMRSLAVPQVAIFRKVRLPAALPYIFSGLKFGTTWSVIGAVVAEFFGGTTQGIGWFIRNKPTAFDFPAAWAAIVVVSLLGMMFYLVVSLVERVLMPWHVSFRDGSR